MIKELIIKYEREEEQTSGEFLEEISLMSNVRSYLSAIYEIRDELRSVLKHQELTDKEHDVIEELQAKLWDITSELPGIE